MPYYVHSDPNADDGHWSSEGQRECARAERCSDPRLETVDGKTTRLPALGPRAFCDADRGAIAKALDDLPTLWVRVHMELGKTSGGTAGPVVSVSKTAPVPLSLGADALLRQVLTTLVSWEERVRTVARLAELDTERSRHRRDGAILTQARQILSAHLDALLALEPEPMLRDGELVDLGGADAGLDLLRLAWKCRAHLTDTRARARHLSGVPCRCGFTDLYEILDDDGQFAGANCRHCRAEYDRDAYIELTKEQSDPVRKSGARRRSVRPAELDDALSRRA